MEFLPNGLKSLVYVFWILVAFLLLLVNAMFWTKMRSLLDKEKKNIIINQAKIN